jgi:BirA family biotin operon repressor/biotin-[acetyl-CoA-carboxylase] ligase
MPRATDQRIDKLIHLLVKNATVVVPGPKVAEEIGVTRSAVWSWVEKLRQMGVDIKGHPAAGYQLGKLPDILAPSLIEPEFSQGHIGHKVVHYLKTGSTNDDAFELASQGAPHGTVVLAEEQTAGRGRFGRAWHSERSSGIYSSILLRPPLPPSAAPALTLMAAVAAHDAVESSTGLNADIRWPNDLLVAGRKLCGILTEMNAEVDCLHAVVIGIGINVNHRQLPPELRTIATSVYLETGKLQARLPILISLLKHLETYYQLLLQQGSGAIAERWAAVSSYACGKRIRVVSGEGEFYAVTLGLEPSGALRVRRDDGREESLVAGEIVEVK